MYDFGKFLRLRYPLDLFEVQLQDDFFQLLFWKMVRKVGIIEFLISEDWFRWKVDINMYTEETQSAC